MPARIIDNKSKNTNELSGTPPNKVKDGMPSKSLLGKKWRWQLTKLYKLIFILLLISSSHLYAESNGKSYIDGSKSFLEIKDTNRQAEAWAMCAATYDVTAEILAKSNPARARQIKDLGNGAEMAVAMSQIINDLSENITPEKFNAVWLMAKLSMTELPKTRTTMLLAEAESNPDKTIFMSNLNATLEVCIKNLEAQQMYIDTWRELAKSGLLQFNKE